MMIVMHPIAVHADDDGRAPSPTPPVALSAHERCLLRRHGLEREALTHADLDVRARRLRALPDCPPAHPIVPTPRPETPPLGGGRVFGEIAVGYLFGFLSGILGGGLASAFCHEDGDFACLGHFLIGFYAGSTFGIAGGVYMVGVNGEQTGSFQTTFAGAGIGAGIGVLSALSGNPIALIPLVAGPMVGALIGFNGSRRWDSPPPVGSLVRVDRGRVALGVPVVLRGETRGVSTTLVPVVSGSF